MAELSEFFDYSSDPDKVINYDEEYNRDVNVYDYIRDIDQSLNKYLTDVVQKIDIEKNYGLNKAAVQINDEAVTYNLAIDIEKKSEELQKRWKKIKKKIEIGTLEKRIENLQTIIDSCNDNHYASFIIPGLGLTDEEKEINKISSEHKELAEGYLEYAKKRLGKLK